jgi:hypothetical protein
MTAEPFSFRPAERADIPGIAALFQTVYQQSSHPCSSSDNVAAGFARGEKWFVCEHRGELVACSALVPHPWNASCEMGRNVTHPRLQGRGLGRVLCRDSVRWATECGGFDLVVGYPRSAQMCRMVCGAITPPTYLFGHDGGANVAHGRRETHAIGLIPSARPCRRAAPTCGAGTRPYFRELVSRLGFRDEAPVLLPDLLVGPPGDHRYHLTAGRGLCYSRMETPLGWSALVSKATGPPGDVARLLARFLADHAAVHHLACYVLWDKLELVARLGVLGFRVTAYLPGWYLRDGLRHDCLYLAWLAPGERTNDNGLSEWLSPVQRALGDFSDALPPPCD